jgi:hypothetical protein
MALISGMPWLEGIACRQDWVGFFKLWERFEKEEMLACFVEEQKVCPITGPSLIQPKKTKPTGL